MVVKEKVTYLPLYVFFWLWILLGVPVIAGGIAVVILKWERDKKYNEIKLTHHCKTRQKNEPKTHYQDGTDRLLLPSFVL